VNRSTSKPSHFLLYLKNSLISLMFMNLKNT
jgi:hypothetical protein